MSSYSFFCMKDHYVRLFVRILIFFSSVYCCRLEAMVAAGTQINSIAELSYTVKGKTHTRSSNRVTVSVAQVYGVAISAGFPKDAFAKSGTVLCHSIQNTGNTSDTMTIEASLVAKSSDRAILKSIFVDSTQDHIRQSNEKIGTAKSGTLTLNGLRLNSGEKSSICLEVAVDTMDREVEFKVNGVGLISPVKAKDKINVVTYAILGVAIDAPFDSGIAAAYQGANLTYKITVSNNTPQDVNYKSKLEITLPKDQLSKIVGTNTSVDVCSTSTDVICFKGTAPDVAKFITTTGSNNAVVTITVPEIKAGSSQEYGLLVPYKGVHAPSKTFSIDAKINYKSDPNSSAYNKSNTTPRFIKMSDFYQFKVLAESGIAKLPYRIPVELTNFLKPAEIKLQIDNDSTYTDSYELTLDTSSTQGNIVHYEFLDSNKKPIINNRVTVKRLPEETSTASVAKGKTRSTVILMIYLKRGVSTTVTPKLKIASKQALKVLHKAVEKNYTISITQNDSPADFFPLDVIKGDSSDTLNDDDPWSTAAAADVTIDSQTDSGSYTFKVVNDFAYPIEVTLATYQAVKDENSGSSGVSFVYLIKDTDLDSSLDVVFKDEHQKIIPPGQKITIDSNAEPEFTVNYHSRIPYKSFGTVFVGAMTEEHGRKFSDFIKLNLISDQSGIIKLDKDRTQSIVSKQKSTIAHTIQNLSPDAQAVTYMVETNVVANVILDNVLGNKTRATKVSGKKNTWSGSVIIAAGATIEISYDILSSVKNKVGIPVAVSAHVDSKPKTKVDISDTITVVSDGLQAEHSIALADSLFNLGGCAPTIIQQQADTLHYKTQLTSAEAANVKSGARLSYRVEVQNIGLETTLDSQVTIQLDKNLKYCGINSLLISSTKTSCTYDTPKHSLECTLTGASSTTGKLKNGEKVAITYFMLVL